jgi:hypothetical protein
MQYATKGYSHAKSTISNLTRPAICAWVGVNFCDHGLFMDLLLQKEPREILK